MWEIDLRLLPVKAHYFFFMAGAGAVLPFLPVLARALGVSVAALGLFTALLPAVVLLSKPTVGALADIFPERRQAIFISAVVGQAISLSLLGFIPPLAHTGEVASQDSFNVSRNIDTNPVNFVDSSLIFSINDTPSVTYSQNPNIITTSSVDKNAIVNTKDIPSHTGNINKFTNTYTSEKPSNYAASNLHTSTENPTLFTEKPPIDIDSASIYKDKLQSYASSKSSMFIDNRPVYTGSNPTTTHAPSRSLLSFMDPSSSTEESLTSESPRQHDDLPAEMSEVLEDVYRSKTFWIYVVLMSVGTVCFNVANSLSDTICFEMLGQGGEIYYGRQRVWGCVGWGGAALLSGWTMSVWSSQEGQDQGQPSVLVPACLLTLLFGALDTISCCWLQLPARSASGSLLKDLARLVRHRSAILFLAFAALIGLLDGFIIYYLLWYLEDLSPPSLTSLKLIEGLVVAAQTLGGEVLFFPLSGWILARLGHGHCLTLCFSAYALRLVLLSLVTGPWWILPIELVLQGPTYALGYSTIVAYASAVAPEGTAATVQGIAAGVDDSLGYSLGSLLGGLLFRSLGGRGAFLSMGTLALVCCLTHFFLHEALRRARKKKNPTGVMRYSSSRAAVNNFEEGEVMYYKQSVDFGGEVDFKGEDNEDEVANQEGEAKTEGTMSENCNEEVETEGCQIYDDNTKECWREDVRGSVHDVSESAEEITERFHV